MIAILNTGGANISSIMNSVEKIQKKYELIDCPDKLQKASSVIIPGVGNMDRIMDNVQKKELYQSIRDLKVPTLGICIGMQIMFEKSDEGLRAGLSLFEGNVRKIKVKENLALPHMGWNKTSFDEKDPF